jgi:hypothetical protein
VQEERLHDAPRAWKRVDPMRLRRAPKDPIPMLAEHEGPLYRRSHPYRAFVIMTLPFVVLPLVVFLPFVGWVLLFVLAPIEFGRIGGKRLSRPDALWVAVPSSVVVSTYELSIVLTVLGSIPGGSVQIDALGLVVTLAIYGINAFFFSVGVLSTAFDPNEPVASDADASAST